MLPLPSPSPTPPPPPPPPTKKAAGMWLNILCTMNICLNTLCPSLPSLTHCLSAHLSVCVSVSFFLCWLPEYFLSFCSYSLSFSLCDDNMVMIVCPVGHCLWINSLQDYRLLALIIRLAHNSGMHCVQSVCHLVAGAIATRPASLQLLILFRTAVGIMCTSMLLSFCTYVLNEQAYCS